MEEKPPPVAPPETKMPLAVKWFRAYLWFFAYVLAFGICSGLVMLLLPCGRLPGDTEVPTWVIWVDILFGPVLLWLFVWLLRSKPTPWMWYTAPAFMVVGLLSCCWIIPCLWMRGQWNKPETKAWFGYTGPESLGKMKDFRSGLIGWLIEKHRRKQ